MRRTKANGTDAFWPTAYRLPDNRGIDTRHPRIDAAMNVSPR